MASVTTNSEAAIFGRLLDREVKTLSPEVAHYILTIGFDDADQARMDELAAKARNGVLTQDEKQELESYIHVADLLALWHSRARRRLKTCGDIS